MKTGRRPRTGPEAGFKPASTKQRCGGAHFHSNDPDSMLRHTKDGGDHGPHGEMALGAGPYGDAAVRSPQGSGHVGLDVALVHSPCRELLLDNDLRIPEPLVNVALLELDVARDVARDTSVIASAVHGRAVMCGHFLVKQGRACFHGVADIQDRLQDLVVDVDTFQSLFGDVGTRGCHGRHGMTFVQGLLPSERVLGSDPWVPWALPHAVDKPGRLDDGHVRSRRNGLDPRHLQCLAGVDVQYSSVSVRAAQHLCVEKTREVNVGAIPRPSGDLLKTVVPDGPRADDAVPRRIVLGTGRSDLLARPDGVRPHRASGVRFLAGYAVSWLGTHCISQEWAPRVHKKAPRASARGASLRTSRSIFCRSPSRSGRGSAPAPCRTAHRCCR